MPSLKRGGQQQHICEICYKIGNTIAAKSGQLGGNADYFRPMFSADTHVFTVSI